MFFIDLGFYDWFLQLGKRTFNDTGHVKPYMPVKPGHDL